MTGAGPDRERTVLVYTPEALPISQPFVADQARNLVRWHPTLVARHRLVDGLDVDDLLSDEMFTSEGRVGPAGRVRRRLTRRIPPLARTAGRLRPDLVHAHFLTGGFDVLGSIRPLSCPVVVTAHGFDATWFGAPPRSWRPDRWLHGLLRQRLVRAPVHFVAVSQFIRDQLVGLGAPPAFVHVVHTGVDCGRFVEPDSGRARSGILFVGRLVAKKGPLDLLEAVATLRAKGVAAPVQVIGDGPLRSELENYSVRHRLDIRFSGACSREQVLEAMQSSALLCAPSATAPSGDREGFGMVLAEAQATGMPVVATKSGGIIDAVADDRTGLLVREGDPQALASALERCLTDGELYRRLSDAARPWVTERFDLRRQAARLEDLYDEVAFGS